VSGSPNGQDDAGRSAKIEIWFGDHADTLFRYLSRRVGTDLARDLVGEVFRVAIERYEHFDSTIGSERAWLFGIATNLLRRHWRTEERRLRALARALPPDQASNDPTEAIDERLDGQSRAELLVDKVAQLTPQDRELLVLVAWEKLPQAEVAAILGIPAGTVRSRLSRIRGQLREGTDHG